MRAALALGLLLAATVARADESAVHIAEGPGAELVQARCAACHSLDYIQMNAPFMARAAWDAEVRKMIRVMHAQVADAEVAPIVDYLATRYGAPAP
jgi:mono/diheme cytochrome c family protein